MPSSNWGPLIDQETPPFIQELYIGQPVDFVFSAQDPESNRRKIGIAVNMVINLVIIGFLAGSFLNNQGLISEFGKPEFWEKIRAEYMDVGDSDTKIIVEIAVVIGIIVVLSIIGGAIRNVIKLFQTTKLWYIGTTDSLIVVHGKKSAPVSWKQFSGETEVTSGPMGDTLKLKFSSGHALPEFLKSLFKINGAFGSFNNTLTIVDPPNIMEVKRLCDKRIKEHSSPETEVINFDKSDGNY